MCGDDIIVSRPWSRTRGAPPRVRGRLALVTVASLGRGSTPACAGTTSASTTDGALTTEHPRVCGDDTGAAGLTDATAGAPPRVRGRLWWHGWHGWHRRSTPACAGTTRRLTCRSTNPTEHPRVCGDDHTQDAHAHNSLGAPPRVRGRRPSRPRRTPGLRSTPACAGTTQSCWPGKRCWTEHPRVCGDDSWPAISSGIAIGAPPRVRGRREQAVTDQLDGRSTPACAGTTPVRRSGTAAGWEHPRVCGDDADRKVQCRSWDGAPPRVRGRRDRDGWRRGYDGSTPACAGTTCWRWCPLTTSREHPRVCGDDPRRAPWP